MPNKKAAKKEVTLQTRSWRDSLPTLAAVLLEKPMDEVAQNNYVKAHVLASGHNLVLEQMTEYVMKGRRLRKCEDHFLNWSNRTIFRECAGGDFTRYRELGEISAEFRLRGRSAEPIPTWEIDNFFSKTLALGDDFVPGFAYDLDHFVAYIKASNVKCAASVDASPTDS